MASWFRAFGKRSTAASPNEGRSGGVSASQNDARSSGMEPSVYAGSVLVSRTPERSRLSDYAIPLQDERATGRRYEENDRFATNATWKFYVGDEKKVYHFPRDHLASKAPGLKLMMDQQVARGGPNEITLSNMRVEEFNVFVYWIQHDCLPTPLKIIDGTALHEPNVVLLILTLLYSKSEEIDAPDFANRIMDRMVAEGLKFGPERLIPTKGIRELSLSGVRNTRAFDYIIERFIWLRIDHNQSDDTLWFLQEFPFDSDYAPLYYAIADISLKFLQQPNYHREMLTLDYMWHNHEIEDVCYSKICNLYRIGALNPTDKPKKIF